MPVDDFSSACKAQKSLYLLWTVHERVAVETVYGGYQSAARIKVRSGGRSIRTLDIVRHKRFRLVLLDLVRHDRYILNLAHTERASTMARVVDLRYCKMFRGYNHMIDVMNQSCDAAFSSTVPASRDDGQVRQYLAADEGKRTRSTSIERK